MLSWLIFKQKKRKKKKEKRCVWNEFGFIKYMCKNFKIKLLTFNRIWSEFELYIYKYIYLYIYIYINKFRFRIGTLKQI